MLHLGLWECNRVRNKARVSSISGQMRELQRRHVPPPMLYPRSHSIPHGAQTSCHPGVPTYHMDRALYGPVIYTVVSKCSF